MGRHVLVLDSFHRLREGVRVWVGQGMRIGGTSHGGQVQGRRVLEVLEVGKNLTQELLLLAVFLLLELRFTGLFVVKGRFRLLLQYLDLFLPERLHFLHLALRPFSYLVHNIQH